GRRVCLVSVCFVFQAEDGIRDFHVTGVQTCALPICLQQRRARWELGRRRRGRPGQGCGRGDPGARREPGGAHLRLRRGVREVRRSEERRVGKEWRLRWVRWQGEKERSWVTRVEGDRR